MASPIKSSGPSSGIIISALSVSKLSLKLPGIFLHRCHSLYIPPDLHSIYIYLDGFKNPLVNYINYFMQSENNKIHQQE
jgi:hypothetical protein